MKSEDTVLLLQDLCARLPYGVKFKWCDGLHDDYYTLIGIDEQYIIGRSAGGHEVLFIIGEDDVKPHLRPMSSMTQEEEEEYSFLLNDGGWGVSENLMTNCIDWLNKNMFDYRGLIPKDLAFTDEFNPYKN